MLLLEDITSCPKPLAILSFLFPCLPLFTTVSLLFLASPRSSLSLCFSIPPPSSHSLLSFPDLSATTPFCYAFVLPFRPTVMETNDTRQKLLKLSSSKMPSFKQFSSHILPLCGKYSKDAWCSHGKTSKNLPVINLTL